jgi:hypothetical protein
MSIAFLPQENMDIISSHQTCVFLARGISSIPPPMKMLPEARYEDPYFLSTEAFIPF